MALKARFIGVNSYADPNISNLSGARRDALALWALFSDSLPGLQAELITASEATVNSIRYAFTETLENATDDDELILFYSGHGSPDHRLAAYDTQLADLINTTVSMQELADLFKQSKAKWILCILDCCFSGGANAKVLQNSPIPRNMGNPLMALAGKGKVILAASNFDEPSYELPTTGHGILTKALLDTLQSQTAQIKRVYPD
jgi:helicase